MRSFCCSLTLLLSFWYCPSLCSVLSFLGNGVFCSVLSPLWVFCCVVLITSPPLFWFGAVVFVFYMFCFFGFILLPAPAFMLSFAFLALALFSSHVCGVLACIRAHVLSLSLSSPVSPSSSLSVYECECVGVHTFVCKYSCVCLLAFACVGVCGCV